MSSEHTEKQIQAMEKYVAYLEQSMNNSQERQQKHSPSYTTYHIFWKHIEVDNLPTSVYIKKTKRNDEYIYYFKMEPRYGISNYRMFEFTDEGTYPTSMYQAFSCYLKTIPNIRFDKHQGRYKLYKQDESSVLDIINIEGLLLEDSEHIKYITEYDKCCVCMENTMTKTSCKHWLCIECESKIQKTIEDEFNDEEDELGEAKCPICRETLIRCDAYLYN